MNARDAKIAKHKEQVHQELHISTNLSRTVCEYDHDGVVGTFDGDGFHSKPPEMALGASDFSVRSTHPEASQRCKNLLFF